MVLDKTGTLTYGNFVLSSVKIEPGFDPAEFWQLAGAVEKYSEHPIARAIFKEAIKHVKTIPDPEDLVTIKGVGVSAKVSGRMVAVGDAGILKNIAAEYSKPAQQALAALKLKAETAAVVLVDGKFAGSIGIADTPRPEAKGSLQSLKNLGVTRILIFTGDNAAVAGTVARSLGVTEVLAELSPEDKLRKLESLPGPVAMVGDGINDAPALARADVGIAMGNAGTAVAVEAADVVILNDNLSRLPEMILLGRKTVSVINWDIFIWAASNLLGFALVLTGIVGPALAAFYNFVTDFLPMINSARLFRRPQLKTINWQKSKSFS